VNRLVESTLAALRRFWRWSQHHRIIGAVVRTLRHHWIEAIAVASLAGLIIAVHPEELVRVYRRLRWELALLMVPVTIGMYVARGVSWWVTLRRVGAGISIVRAVAVELAGQVMIFMPTGDLARVAILEETEGVDQSAGRITGTIAFQELLYMTIVGLGVLPRLFSRPTVALLVLAMTISHALIFTVLIWERAYRWAVRTVERIRVLRRFDRQLKDIRRAFMELLDWRTLAPAVLMNALAATLSFVLFFLALRAIGVTHVGFVAATFVLALGHLLSGLSFLPGGVGAFEGILTVLMLANGVPPAQGAAAGILYRAYNDLLMAAIGACVGMLLPRTRSTTGRRARRSRSRRTPAHHRS
jgi:uncharacterized protein (TIRG00374 family)